MPETLHSYSGRQEHLRTLSGSKQLLSFVTGCPAVENILSLGAEVAGTETTDLAILTSSG